MSNLVNMRGLEPESLDKYSQDEWVSVAEPIEDSASAHEQYVAYVHSLNGDAEPRTGLWLEHSYARAPDNNLTSNYAGQSIKALLIRKPCLPKHPNYKTESDIDVEAMDTYPIPPPESPIEPLDEEDAEEDDWEQKIELLAPSDNCKRALSSVIEILRSFRLSKLCGSGGARDESRTHARYLRRAFAPLWSGPVGRRPAAWLHVTLMSYLPQHYKALYEEMLSELRRSVPRLCERLQAAQLPAPADEYCPKPGPAVMPMSSRPLLVWIGCGVEKADARWGRRLRALVPTHYIGLHNSEACSPETWCVNAVSCARSSLAALDAGRESCSSLALGGCGAGAAVALQLAVEDKRVKSLIMLSPPILTAEGDGESHDDLLADLRIPTLMVIGECAMTAWWGAASDVSRGRKSAHILVVGSADDHLYIPHAKRRAFNLPQYALDSAIADECARWLTEIVEDGEMLSHNHEAFPPHKTVLSSRAGKVIEEEYSHLAHHTFPPLENNRVNNNIEIVKTGRIISRGRGSTPLGLIPPKRQKRSSKSPSQPAIAQTPVAIKSPPSIPVNAEPRPGESPTPDKTPDAPNALSTDDIMNMPIVLMDDEADVPPLAANENNNTNVRKTASPIMLKVDGPKKKPTFTKVILAKRGVPNPNKIVIHSQVRILSRSNVVPR